MISPAFNLISEIFLNVSNFLINCGQSTLNLLTISGMDPAPMSGRHGCGTRSEEFAHLNKIESPKLFESNSSLSLEI